MTGTFQKRSLNAWLTGCSALLAALALAGCGGEEQTRQPGIDLTAARQLADRSDEVARLLDAERVCEAAHAADRLESEARAAVDGGAVPQALAEELDSRATELVNEVNCPQPAPPPADEGNEDKGNGKGKGRGKGKGKGHRGDGDEG